MGGTVDMDADRVAESRVACVDTVRAKKPLKDDQD